MEREAKKPLDNPRAVTNNTGQTSLSNNTLKCALRG